MADDTGEIGREAAEAVGFSNIKVVGEGPAFYQNQAMGETLANTQAMNQLRMTLLGKIAESVIAVSPTEGGVDTAALGILAKLVQGTPPPTNIPTQGQ